MTDAEVICTWMAGPKPSLEDRTTDHILRGFHEEDINGWWLLTTTGYEEGDEVVILPRDLDLDALHKVEARLTDEQWRYYCAEFAVQYIPQSVALETNHEATVAWDRAHLHASAEQKIAALAAVLRPEVDA